MPKEKIIKAWGITDWGGGIKHPSVSIFDTKKDAQMKLDNFYNKLPEPSVKGERNKIVKVEIKIIGEPISAKNKKVMNREIKFRGKSTQNGEWYCGYYLVNQFGEHTIFGKDFAEKVIPETVQKVKVNNKLRRIK